MSLEERIALSTNPELVRTMLSFLIPMAIIQLVLGIVMYIVVYRPIKKELLQQSGYRILKIRRNKFLMFLCGALTFAPYWVIGFELEELIWKYFTYPETAVPMIVRLYGVSFAVLFLAMLLHKSRSGATMGQIFRLALSMTFMSVYYGIVGLLGFAGIFIILASIMLFGAGLGSMQQESRAANYGNYCPRCGRTLPNGYRCNCDG